MSQEMSEIVFYVCAKFPFCVVCMCVLGEVLSFTRESVHSTLHILKGLKLKRLQPINLLSHYFF